MTCNRTILLKIQFALDYEHVIILEAMVSKRNLLLVFCLSLFAPITCLHALESGRFSLQVTPGLAVPLGLPSETYSYGFGVEATGILSMPFAPWLISQIGVEYTISPVQLTPRTLSLITFGLGLGVNINLVPWLNVRVAVSGGYYVSAYNDSLGGSAYIGRTSEVK